MKRKEEANADGSKRSRIEDTIHDEEKKQTGKKKKEDTMNCSWRCSAQWLSAADVSDCFRRFVVHRRQCATCNNRWCAYIDYWLDRYIIIIIIIACIVSSPSLAPFSAAIDMKRMKLKVDAESVVIIFLLGIIQRGHNFFTRHNTIAT
jgi:hypothetical protein